jgi:5-methylcytosine-specific restriction endonuclease McrBC GTP-binding regulatory subunit McrB
MRLFISGLASTKLIILQGISGTGKTSLSYAWGKFMKHDSCVASVQPSWRDRTDLFGYFNEFTKKFNETEMLKYMYEAGYTDGVYTIILDEMNLSRVEYYFAEMLSILEMPNRDEWIIELVPNSWKSDPKKIISGKLKVPANMWYIGTINNDDSTFAVTDKVYDRAMPIDINDKGVPFEPIDTDATDINFTYMDNLFKTAMEENPISDEMMEKINLMDDYVIKHFRIAFGNRIVTHMKKFVPVYVACGGDETEGVDYFIAKKILRKFEQLNISYIRDELDPYIEFLNKTFGKDKMAECIEYILRLKKLT